MPLTLQHPPRLWGGDGNKPFGDEDAWDRVFINPSNDTILNGFNVQLRGFIRNVTPASTDPTTGAVTPETVTYGLGNISIDELTLPVVRKKETCLLNQTDSLADTTALLLLLLVSLTSPTMSGVRYSKSRVST